jgi:hypothetical protein
MKFETVLELKSGPGNPRNSEGAFITLKNGSLMYIYTRYEGGDWNDHAPACIAARLSDREGRVWSAKHRVVARRGEDMNVMSVSALRLQNGSLALLYLRKMKAPGFFCDCRPFIRFSDDECKTWSDPRPLISTPGYFVVNNDRMIQLQSGRLLVPAALHRDKAGGIDSRGIAFVYYSDDNGLTWSEAPDWILPPHDSVTGFQEPGVAELSDGRVMAWFRTGQGCQYKSFSTDGGLHWSPAAPAPEFPAPASPMSIKRNPEDKELYAVWNDHSAYWRQERVPSSWGRTPLVIAKSSDDGVSWHSQTILEDAPDHGFCYTAMHFIPGALLLGYCCGGGKTAVLQDSRLRRVSLRAAKGPKKR